MDGHFSRFLKHYSLAIISALSAVRSCMASAPKRRAPERKRSVKTSGKASLPSRASWTNEALAVVCSALCVFLLVSLLSSPMARELVGVETTARNLMGPVGHVTGVVLSGLFGWCALVPVLWLAWLAVFLWNRGDQEPLWAIDAKAIRLAGLLGMLVFSCSLVSLIVVGANLGGSTGTVVSSPLVRLFSRFGASIIVCALLLSSVALSTRQSVGAVVVVLVGWAWVASKWLFVEFPMIAWRVVLLLLSVLGTVLSSLIGSGKGLSRRAGDGRAQKASTVKSKRAARGGEPAGSESQSEELDGVNDEDEDSGEEESASELPSEVSPPVVQRKVNEGAADARKPRKMIVHKNEEPLFEGYEPPDINLLSKGEPSPGSEDDEELQEKSRQIEAKLRDFGVLGKVTQIHPGPVITLFEFEPAPGVKVGKIASLQDDLAMSLKASSIRIIAPIPKRGTVGIEVPNRNREIVRLRDILESESFLNSESSLTVPIGKDTYGDPVVADISSMPHLLIAGATGTGKSVCINALLVSMLYRASPAELGLIMIDPKILELSVYDGIPHLRVPVVTVPRQAKAVLDWAVNEMNRRYRVMQKFGVRNIDSYNRVVQGEQENLQKKERDRAARLADEIEISQDGTLPLDPELAAPTGQDQAEGAVSGESEAADEVLIQEQLRPLPKIVIVIDELADLMLTVGRDIEELITRLAQKARAAGIHLIVATQRPSVDVITGLIKANFPARLSFRVSSRIDSRTILDCMGADKLLGRGDMLFMQPGAEGLRRLHGAFVSDSEVKKVVDAVKEKFGPHYDERIIALCEKALAEEAAEKSAAEGGAPPEDEYDDMYDKCVELVLEKGQASTSMLQRVFRLGYNRAARIIDMMEREGIVGPMDGAKPREVRVQNPETPIDS